MNQKKFEFIFIGAGPGGYSSAAILASKGKSVAIIEKNKLGGTCVNEGCIPTKSLLKSAKVYNEIQKCGLYGISTQGVHFEFGKIIQNLRDNSKVLNGAIAGALEAAGVTTIHGEALVIDKNTVEVNGEKIYAENLVLSTGSRSRDIDFPGKDVAMAEKVLINSTELLYLEQLPQNLVILGAGPVSLEFSYFFASFGTKVTILDFAPKILGNFDEEVGLEATKILTSKGIEIVSGVEEYNYQSGGVISYKKAGENFAIKADKFLLAVGRVANIENFANLELELNSNKTVKVNHKMETSLPGVYAIGDVTGALMLTTTAYKQGDVLLQNLLGLEIEQFRTDTIAWSIYLAPEISGVGLSAKQAKEKYGEDNVLDVTIPAQKLPRNHIEKKLDFGFIKFIVKKDDGKFLGAYIVLEDSSLIINEVALAIAANLTVFDIVKVGHTHPTLSEAIYYLVRTLAFKLK
ncbi:dihydrolipoyl dehydrogenase [Candidatus Mycoplasma pogonae]